MDVNAAVLLQALEQAFAKNERLKTYVLDDQGALRKHMRILIDGQSITDRQTFKDAVRPGSEIWIMQALSGG